MIIMTRDYFRKLNLGIICKYCKQRAAAVEMEAKERNKEEKSGNLLK